MALTIHQINYVIRSLKNDEASAKSASQLRKNRETQYELQDMKATLQAKAKKKAEG